MVYLYTLFIFTLLLHYMNTNCLADTSISAIPGASIILAHSQITNIHVNMLGQMFANTVTYYHLYFDQNNHTLTLDYYNLPITGSCSNDDSILECGTGTGCMGGYVYYIMMRCSVVIEWPMQISSAWEIVSVVFICVCVLLLIYILTNRFRQCGYRQINSTL